MTLNNSIIRGYDKIGVVLGQARAVLSIGVILLVLAASPGAGSACEPAEQDGQAKGRQARPDAGQERRSIQARVQAMLNPKVVALPNESRVIHADRVRLGVANPEDRQAALRWLRLQGAVVLEDDTPGLELNYYAQGIEAMTRADLIWEGLPKRADSLQMLVDDAITQARQAERPIHRLVIIGHAGLPGCAALGGTLDDCVFKGRLSAYQKRQLVRLRPYLAQDSEIELRQCVTGFGEQGQRLLTAIHQLTSATAISYLADLHFGDSAAHPTIRVDHDGVRLLPPKKDKRPKK